MTMSRKLSLGAGLLILGAATSGYAVTAETVFPDKIDAMVLNGTYARKGTIGATLINVVTLDKLLLAKGADEEVNAILNDQRGLGAALHALGVFEAQPLQRWLRDEKRPGKIIVAILALEECPELLTESVKSRLQELKETSHPLIKAEIEQVLSLT